jgi:hypothetical protein
VETLFLNTFVAVVNHGSMAAAARLLNITPAAVAQQIRTLEREIAGDLRLSAGTNALTGMLLDLLARIQVFIKPGYSPELWPLAWWVNLVHPYFYPAISILLCIVIGCVARLFFPPPTRSLKGLTIYGDKLPRSNRAAASD